MGDSLTESLIPVLRRPVGPGTRALAALHVLDWISTAAAALGRPEGRALLSLAQRSPTGDAWTAGAGGRDAATAALVNGGLALTLEMDATHRAAKLHPGPPVIASALSLAQTEKCGPEEFLDAVVRGYEAMIRVGMAFGPGHYRLWHTTGTAGAFGAAAAASSLLAASDDEFADALGLAGSRTSGLWQTRPERAMAKPLHAGGSAQAGLYAGLLATAGMSGPRRILEGELGLFAATCPDPDPQALTRETRAGWLIHDTSLKPWAACRHVHPAIDAALRVRPRIEDADDIMAIRVLTYPEALTFADNSEPEGEQSAMFSLQHCVSLALAAGGVNLEDFSDEERRQNEQICRLRDLTSVSVGEPWASAYPQHWGARVVVVLRDREVCAEVRDTLGDPENPLTAQQVLDKADGLLCRAGVEVAQRERLAAAVLALAEGASLEGLGGLLP